MRIEKPSVHCATGTNNFVPGLGADEFRLFQSLVLRESGIHLGARNRAMLVSRLWKRLRALELNSFAAYYRQVKTDPQELVRMLDCICTNETHFFREHKAFDCLRQYICPQWKAAVDAQGRNKTLRVWSAACSSGDEPYSLAMMLLSEFPGWNVQVLGTDLSTKILAQAVKGVWPSEKISAVPLEYQRRFLLRGFGPDKGKIKVGDELRGAVRFQRLNLMDQPPAIGGPFDLIFCRNVLIYFQWEMKLQVVNRLGKSLARDGYLFLGHAESLHGVTDKLYTVTPKIFPNTKFLTGSGALCVLQRRETEIAAD